MSAGADTREGAALPREDTPTYRIQYGRRKCALPQQCLRQLLPGCTIDRALPRHAVQPLAPPMPRTSVRLDSSATNYHNTYAVDLTVCAATYTAPTGASPMGQVKTPLGQRVYRAMKRIQKEIHKSLLMSF